MRLARSLVPTLVAALTLGCARPEAGERPGGGTSMKTIGVLGGIGPQATMDFEARVHRESQRRIPTRANAGYPPMVVIYHRAPPIIVDESGRPVRPLQIDPEFLRAAERLKGSADFLVIPSNTPHVFKDQIERASGLPLLSILDVTLAEVRSRGWKKIGVVGMGDPTFYTSRLAEMGLAFETLDPALRDRVDAGVLRLMEGSESDDSRSAALRERGVDGIILGCTEVPLLLGPDAEAADLVNPAQLLAQAAVARAIE